MECLATETHPTNQTEGIPSPVVGEGWSLVPDTGVRVTPPKHAYPPYARNSKDTR